MRDQTSKKVFYPSTFQNERLRISCYVSFLRNLRGQVSGHRIVISLVFKRYLDKKIQSTYAQYRSLWNFGWVKKKILLITRLLSRMFYQSTFYPVHILSLQSRVQSNFIICKVLHLSRANCVHEGVYLIMWYNQIKSNSFTHEPRTYNIFPLIASHLAFCALIVEIDRSIDPEGLFSFPMDIKFKYFPGKSSQVLNKGWFFELPKSNGKNYICHASINSIPRNTRRDIRLFQQNLNV